MNPGLQRFIDSLIHPKHHGKDLPFWENSKQFPIILQIFPHMDQIFVCLHEFLRVCICLSWATKGKTHIWTQVFESVFCLYLIHWSKLDHIGLKKSAKFLTTRGYQRDYIMHSHTQDISRRMLFR
jgi:hypothetical protein